MYEYQCSNPECGYQFDALSKVISDAAAVCPKCNNIAPLIFSAPARIEFKGPAWNA